MRGGRWWLLAVLTIAAAVGCLWVREPYADDPLVRRRPTPMGEPTAVPNAEPIARPAPTESTDRLPSRGADLP
jgi:hypothetical protein